MPLKNAATFSGEVFSFSVSALVTAWLSAPSASPTQATSQKAHDSQRDQRLFDALDYITSSLIRLEEKLEDIEQRLPEVELSLPDENDEP